MSSLALSATGGAATAVHSLVPRLVGSQVASRVLRADDRLPWHASAHGGRPLVGLVAALREQARERGLRRVVLVASPADSLGAQAICATSGARLAVTSAPDDEVCRALLAAPQHALVVVVATGGELDERVALVLEGVQEVWQERGLEAAHHLVAVAHPSSRLADRAQSLGGTLVHAEHGARALPAFSAHALVPSGFAGVDISAVLDDADEVADLLCEDDEANPALRLAALLLVSDAVTVTDEASPDGSLGAWVSGLLDAADGGPPDGPPSIGAVLGKTPETPAPQRIRLHVRLLPESADEMHPAPLAGASRDAGDGAAYVAVAGSLGAQLLLWLAATTVAAHPRGAGTAYAETDATTHRGDSTDDRATRDRTTDHRST